LNRMAREEVVPWSMARTYFFSVLLGLKGMSFHCVVRGRW